MQCNSQYWKRSLQLVSNMRAQAQAQAQAQVEDGWESEEYVIQVGRESVALEGCGVICIGEHVEVMSAPCSPPTHTAS